MCPCLRVSACVLGFLEPMHPSSAHFSAGGEESGLREGRHPEAPRYAMLLIVTSLTHPHT